MNKNSKITAEKCTYRIVWSEDDHCHIARCLEFPSLAAHGATAEEALREIEQVVNESIKWLQEEHEPIPEPFGMRKFRGATAGQEWTHPPTEKHRELAIRSAEEGVSVNQFILSRL